VPIDLTLLALEGSNPIGAGRAAGVAVVGCLVLALVSGDVNDNRTMWLPWSSAGQLQGRMLRSTPAGSAGARRTRKPKYPLFLRPSKCAPQDKVCLN
jgi:hypothetical protein